MKTTPTNGLVLCCGEIESDSESEVVYRGSVVFEPPMPIKRSYYRCDSHFHLDTIGSMYTEEGEEIGLMIVKGDEARLYVILSNPPHWEVKERKVVSGQRDTKTRRGGQSANRISRNNDIQRDGLVTKMAERAVAMFENRVRGLLIVGPSHMKHHLCDHAVFKSRLGHLLVGCETADDRVTIEECLDRWLDLFYNDPTAEALEEIATIISTHTDLLVFGRAEASKQPLEKLWFVDKADAKALKNVVGEKCQLIAVSPEFMSHYGPLVGRKFFG